MFVQHKLYLYLLLMEQRICYIKINQFSMLCRLFGKQEYLQLDLMERNFAMPLIEIDTNKELLPVLEALIRYWEKEIIEFKEAKSQLILISWADIFLPSAMKPI